MHFACVHSKSESERLNSDVTCDILSRIPEVLGVPLTTDFRVTHAALQPNHCHIFMCHMYRWSQLIHLSTK